jgi:N-acetylglucosamine-6-sulfatase
MISGDFGLREPYKAQPPRLKDSKEREGERKLMIWLRTLGVVLLAIPVLWAEPAASGSPGPPNIVVVLVDDLRWDDIAIAGHPFVKTPHIDRLAREGVRFRNAFATTPLCSPSRASFLTGLYPHAHGITDNTDRSPASHQLSTFPRQLQRGGYETAFLGKWHMGNDDSPRPGFDYWVSMKGQGEAVDPYLNEAGSFKKVPGYITDLLTDRVVAFIERPRTKPFLVYLAHKALHPNMVQRDDGSVSAIGEGGFIPADRHRQLYAGETVPRSPSALRGPEGKPALQRPIGNLPPLTPGTGTSEKTVLDRLRMLAAVDESLGRIRAALNRIGQLDNTAIVFTSDHGYFYGEYGLDEERRLAYEATIRIPLIIRYPKLARGGSAPDQMALSIDLAPTLLELAGVRPSGTMHGRSLVPILSGRAVTWRTSFLVEYFTDTVFPRILNMGYQAVRTERYKYIHYTELNDMDELYDLRSDPHEMKNSIGSPASQSVLRRMQQELAMLRQQTK